MKVINFVLGMVISLSNSSAFALEMPHNLCEAEPCSLQQKNIWNSFSTGSTVGSSDLEHVFSGECYYRSPGYGSDKTQYGIALLEKDGQKVFFNGAFSFFFESNPYAGWTTEQAKKHFQGNRNENSAVHLCLGRLLSRPQRYLAIFRSQEWQ